MVASYKRAALDPGSGGPDVAALAVDAGAPVERSLRGTDVSEDVRRLVDAARDLLTMAASLEGAAQRQSPRPRPALHGGALALARWEYRRRRTRAQFFGDDGLFGEPAWDMLLDLFIAGVEGKRVPVTSACIGSAVPTTTALRWLAALEERGLVVRDPDPTDARRALVRLSPEGMARMEQYLDRARNEAPL